MSMFAGQYYCKIDEKGRFVVPPPISGKTSKPTAHSLMFLKSQDLPVFSLHPNRSGKTASKRPKTS